MAKKKEMAKVLSQQCLQTGIYDMWIETSLANEAKAGQFICVYPKNASTLLPRPISICEVREDRHCGLFTVWQDRVLRNFPPIRQENPSR